MIDAAEAIREELREIDARILLPGHRHDPADPAAPVRSWPTAPS
jgi:hypothetical protein